MYDEGGNWAALRRFSDICLWAVGNRRPFSDIICRRLPCSTAVMQARRCGPIARSLHLQSLNNVFWQECESTWGTADISSRAFALVLQTAPNLRKRTFERQGGVDFWDFSLG